jgi:hypothetical protein
MNRFIPKDANRDAAIALIEVLEIRGDNPHVTELSHICHERLAIILQGATPAFLVSLILEARRKVRDEGKLQ